MPKRPAPYGATVSPRNGGKILLSPAPRVMVELPEGLELCAEAEQAWAAFWEDPVTGALTPADRVIVLRWVDALNRYHRMVAEADLEPIVAGSKIDNPRPNPLYVIADRALATAKNCEYQLGIGARNRTGLGMAIAEVAEKVPVKPRRAIASVTRIDPREESTG